MVLDNFQGAGHTEQSTILAAQNKQKENAQYLFKDGALLTLAGLHQKGRYQSPFLPQASSS